MIDFLTNPVFAGFLASTMRLAVPILLVALGGMFCERSGVLNIGLEGMMLIGCFSGFIAVFWTGSLAFGMLTASLTGAGLGLLLAWFAVSLRANQVVVGIALNIAMLGITSFLFRLAFGVQSAAPRITTFQSWDFGFLSDIPVLGPLIFSHDAMTYGAFVLVALSLIIFRHSGYGRIIDAVGEHPEAAQTLGLNVVVIRYVALAIGGALAGIGGAFLSLSATGLFLDNMTAGRGYIALAILIVGRRHPVGIVFAALLFGAAEAIQLRAQLLPIGVPVQFLIMLPYVLTVVVLAFFAGRTGAPAALGKPLPVSR